MVGGEGERERLADHDLAVLHHRLGDRGADTEDGSVGRVNDREEFGDAHHAEVGHAEGAASELVGFELLVLGQFAQRFGFAADLEDRLVVGVFDDRGDQSVGQSHGEGDVGCRQITNLSAFPCGIHIGHAAQGLGAAFEDEVVDGELHAGVGEALVELFAQGEERLGVDLDFEVEMRDRGLGFDEAFGDHAAHGGNRDGAFDLDRALGAHGAAGEGRAGALGRSSGRFRVFGSSLDVGPHDAAVGTGALHGGGIDAQLGGELFGERRDFDAITEGQRRSGRGVGCCGGRGGNWFRGGRRCGGGSRGRGCGFGLCLRGGGSGGGDDFALFTHGAQGCTQFYLGTGVGENFEDRAVEKALELHRRFIGFNFGEDVAGLDGIAFFFKPFAQRAHRHGVAEFRHFDDIGHGAKSLRWRAKLKEEGRRAEASVVG